MRYVTVAHFEKVGRWNDGAFTYTVILGWKFGKEGARKFGGVRVRRGARAFLAAWSLRFPRCGYWQRLARNYNGARRGWLLWVDHRRAWWVRELGRRFDARSGEALKSWRKAH